MNSSPIPPPCSCPTAELLAPLLSEWPADSRCETEFHVQHHLFKAIFPVWFQPTGAHTPLIPQSFYFTFLLSFPGIAWE